MENKNGQGIFLGVVGVATLVVAIIGATFAFFSASATVDPNSEAITGSTYNMASANLGIKVTRVNKTVTNAASIDLVPTNIDPTSISNVNTAVSNNCEALGYTACHIYKIEATTGTALDNVTMTIDSLTLTGVGSATDKSSWKYVVYEGTDTTATNMVTNGSFEILGTTQSPAVGFHGTNGAGAALSTSGKTYYLLIFVANDTSNQQNVGGDDAHDVQGTYTGTVSMAAAGGKVAATFTFGG